MVKQDKKIRIPWKLLFNVAVILLTLGMVAYFVFSEGGFIELINKITSGKMKVSPGWVTAAVFAHLLNLSIDAVIIYLFLRETTPGLKFKTALIGSMVGQFFCAVTPSSTGGQPMQILTLSRLGVKASNVTSALIQKFLVWQFTLAAYCTIAIVFKFQFFAQKLDAAMWTLTIIGFLAQLIMIGILLLASFAKGITTRIARGLLKFLGKLHIIKDVDERISGVVVSVENFHESNKALNKNKTLLVKVYVLTAIQMTSFFLVPFCIARSFTPDCSMFDMLCAQSYVNMVSSLMPLPGGSGAAEYSFSVFFGSYFSEETLKTAILLWRTITYYGTILISMPFAQIHGKKDTEKKTVTEKVKDSERQQGAAVSGKKKTV